MFRKTLVIGFVALLLMSLATVAIAIEWDGVPDDPTPSQAVWVDPKNTPCLSIGETFVVDILVNITSPTSPGGTGLFGWEYKLSWNTSVIDTDQASSTPHVLPGTGFLVADDWSVPGRHWYAWTLFMPPSFTGVTSLCTYNFTVVGSGGSVLDLFETEFTDDTATVIISDTAAIGTTVDGIYCTAPHQFPVACFTFSPPAPVVGETVSFDASCSFDPDGTIVGWDWDFGDNSTDSGEIVTHAYAAAGDYTVALVVTDNDALTDTATDVVTVFVGAVQAVWVNPKNTACLSIGETFVVEALCNITDPDDAGPATGLFGFEFKLRWDSTVLNVVSIQYHTPTEWTMPFEVVNSTSDISGDGFADRHWVAVAALMGTGFTGFTSVCTYTFKVAGTGGSVLDLFETEFTDDTATVIISDTAAIGTTVDGIYCTAPHQFPVACFTFSPSAPVVGETVSFDASCSFDPDGTIVGWDWDFGDNSTDSGMIVTHAYAMAWHYTVTLTVTDNDGLADTARVVVTVFDVPCTLNEYFYWVSYYPFDNDFDGYNDAVEVEMDVDTDYSGTLDVTVDAYLIDPYGATVDSDYPWWSITDAWYDYGYAYLYVPPGSPEGWYSVELTLYDECWNYEDYMYSENVFYYQAEPCSFDEYFYEVNYYPFDNDFDGYNDAIIVEMDVDTDYSGTLTVYVDAYLIDPYGATVDSDFASWSIIDYAVEWGYVYLYVPDCGQFGWYDVELVLGDQCWNFEDYRYDSFVAHLYPPGVKLDTTLDFWFQPNPTHPGDTVELLGTLTDVYGNPVYPAQAGVEYSTDGGATWHYIWTLNTDAAGEFSRTFTAPGVGEYLVRVSYGGSASYNPTSDMETLTVQKLWGTYHFQIAPFVDVVHLNVDGSVIYGICDGEGFYHNQPVLGYIQGGSFYLFIDFTKDDFGNPIYYELAMLVGSVSTLSGNTYRTTDGTSWDGPTPFTLVSVSSSSEPSATGQALASPSTIEPQAWLPTSHFQIAPFVDVVHLGVDRPVLHGQCDALSYHDQPVLGYVVGDFFIFAIDFTKDDFGDPIYHELAIIAGSVSTKTGNMYRTVDGKSWDGPTPLTLVPAPP